MLLVDDGPHTLMRHAELVCICVTFLMTSVPFLTTARCCCQLHIP
jgi:hypothetical protein